MIIVLWKFMITIYQYCFYTPAFKNVGVLCYTAVVRPSVHLSVCPLDFVFATPPKPFEGFWWNLVQRKTTLCRCAYYKGTPVPSLSKELQPLDLAFSVKSTLSLQLLLNPLGDFDETWYKERSHCVDVHIIRGPLSNYFSGSYGLWT